MPYYLYILQSHAHNKYYIGSMANLADRLNRHNSGRSKYIKAGIPWELVYKEKYVTHSEAIRREKQLISWKNKDLIESLVKTSPDP